MLDRQLKGAIIEYHRVKHRISVKRYLTPKSFEICSTKTYKKVIIGTCEIDEIYDQIINLHKIEINYNQQVDTFFNEIAKNTKSMVEDNDDENFARYFKEKKYNEKNNTYPNIYFCDLYEMIYRTFIIKEKISQTYINQLLILIAFVHLDWQTLFYYANFVNKDRGSSDNQSLNSLLKTIPNYLSEEILMLKAKNQVLMYEGEFNKALTGVIKLEKILIKNKKYNMLMRVYEMKHGILHDMGKKEESKKYLNELENALNGNPYDLTTFTINAIKYYLGMDFFSVHEINISYHYIKDVLNSGIIMSEILVLTYLHMSFVLGEIDDLKIQMNRLKVISPSRKIFKKYFEMKLDNISKTKLRKYLLERVEPTINKNDVFEIHIFLNELLNFKNKQDFMRIYNKCKSSNYVMWENWDVLFEKEMNLL